MSTIHNTITITKLDQNRLQNFITKRQNTFELKNDTKIVEEKLKLKPVDSNRVSPTVVTMNTRDQVRNLMMNKTFEVKLVYPDAVGVSGQKIAIFSSGGASMFGHSQGDDFAWARGKLQK